MNHEKHVVEMILCRWKPLWEPEEHIAKSLVANYERRMTTERATEVPESPVYNAPLPMEEGNSGKEDVEEQEEGAEENSLENHVSRGDDEDDSSSIGSNCSNIHVVTNNDLTEEERQDVNYHFEKIMANLNEG